MREFVIIIKLKEALKNNVPLYILSLLIFSGIKCLKYFIYDNNIQEVSVKNNTKSGNSNCDTF